MKKQKFHHNPHENPSQKRRNFFRFGEASSEKEGAVDPVSPSFGMLGISFVFLPNQCACESM